MINWNESEKEQLNKFYDWKEWAPSYTFLNKKSLGIWNRIKLEWYGCRLYQWIMTKYYERNYKSIEEEFTELSDSWKQH